MVGATSLMGLISGFEPAREPLVVSFLQFADDTLIFCGAEEKEIVNVKAFLLCFEAVSAF